MLVFAVSITIGQNIRGAVRGIAAHAEVHTDVAESSGNKIINGANLFVLGGLSLNELLGSRANFRGDTKLRLLQ